MEQIVYGSTHSTANMDQDVYVVSLDNFETSELESQVFIKNKTSINICFEG